MSEAMVFEAIRTPRGRGKANGSLHEVKPISLLTGVLKELQKRHDLDTAQVDDVVMGCVTPVGDRPAAVPGYNDGLLWVSNEAAVSTWLATWLTDADGEGLGVAITGLSGNGVWEYSTDGVVWQTAGAVGAKSALLLAATGRLRFTPAPGFNGTASVTFRGWDGTAGTAGPGEAAAWKQEVRDIGRTMAAVSACGLGIAAPGITESLLTRFEAALQQ